MSQKKMMREMVSLAREAYGAEEPWYISCILTYEALNMQKFFLKSRFQDREINLAEAKAAMGDILAMATEICVLAGWSFGICTWKAAKGQL